MPKSLICIVIFVCFALAGCAVRPPAPLEPLDFSARGKFSLKNTGDERLEGAPRSVTASFAWEQLGGEYRVAVWGALGQGRVQMTGNEGWMRLNRGEQALAAGPPGEVMEANLGWSLPVATVPSWLRGQPLRADTALVTRSTDPLVQYFDEGGWRVEFSRFRDPGRRAPAAADSAVAATLPESQPQRVPGRITAVNGTRRITVVVREFLQ